MGFNANGTATMERKRGEDGQNSYHRESATRRINDVAAARPARRVRGRQRRLERSGFISKIFSAREPARNWYWAIFSEVNGLADSSLRAVNAAQIHAVIRPAFRGGSKGWRSRPVSDSSRRSLTTPSNAPIAVSTMVVLVVR